MASHYQALGLAPTASADEIRAAYRRLAAVQRPPELAPGAQHLKRMGKGGRTRESTVEERMAWLRIQQAFDVLANPRRREPYDRRLAADALRSGSVMAAGPGVAEAPGPGEELAPLDVAKLEGEELLDAVSAYFEAVAANEPPATEDYERPPSFDEASRFYDYWGAWSSRRIFGGAERHGSTAVAAAESRQVRRLMEAEDEKLRRQARKAYSAKVREAAKHAQQFDPRVRQQREDRRREEALKAERHEEERAAEKLRREEARQAQRQAAREADEARWAMQTPELQAQCTPELNAEREAAPGSTPLRCLACAKGFKTRDAWLDHAASKRHRYNARRWEEAGRGNALLEGGSPLLSSPSCAWSASPAGSRRLSSPLELPEAAWLPPGSASPDLEPLPEPAMLVGDHEASASCLAAESPTSEDFSLPNSASAAEVATSRSEAGHAPSSSSRARVPTAFEAFADLPSHIWVKILGAIGCSLDCAHAAIGLLSSAVLREGELGEPSLWSRLADELWGAGAGAPAAAQRGRGGAAEARRGYRRFLALAAGADEAWELWTLLGGAPAAEGGEEPRKARLVRRQPLQGFQAEVLDAAPGLVAAAQRDTEVRLFSGQLSRLPPLRTKGKRVAALAVEPGCERLAVGAADGQVSIYSVTDPEEMPSRLQRVALSDASASFAGLFFAAPSRLVVALRGDLSAVLYDAEIRGPPVASSSGSLPETSEQGLLAAAALGGEAVLLTDCAGHARIWDVRAPRLATALDLSMECTASAVDPARWTLLASSPSALHWADLRAQRSARLRTERLPAGPPLLACGARGSAVACWVEAKATTAYLFAGGYDPVPVHAGEVRAVPLAACRSAGGGPLLLSLARPSASRKWDFELCAVGVRAAAQLPSVLGRPRPERVAAAPVRRPPLRRQAARGPPREGLRRP